MIYVLNGKRLKPKRGLPILEIFEELVRNQGYRFVIRTASVTSIIKR